MVSKKKSTKVSKKSTSRKSVKSPNKKVTRVKKAVVKSQSRSSRATPEEKILQELDLIKKVAEEYISEAAELARHHKKLHGNVKKRALKVAKSYDALEKATKKLVR